MPATITASGATATSFNLAISGLAGVTMDVQVAARPDFGRCVCPIVNMAAGSSVTVTGLNQSANYFVRVRGVDGAGDADEWSNTYAVRTLPGAARDTDPAAIMIKPALLVVPAAVVSWTADDQQDGFPVENLGFDAPVAWHSVRAAGTHGFVAQIAADDVDTIALLSSNAPENATVRIKAGNSLSNVNGGSPTYSYGPIPFRASANMPGRPGFHSLITLPAAQRYSFWRVEIIAPDLFGDLLHLEHAVLGWARRSKNHALDKTETPADQGSISYTRGGVPIRSPGARMRRVDFEIALMTEAQYETTYGDLGWLVGNTEPVLVVPNMKEGAFLHDRILYGNIVSSKITNPASPRYTRSFTIDSVLP